MEQSRFATKCKKIGGYFKCCVKKWLLNVFEETRNQLIEDKLINDNITNICDKTSSKDRCLFCSANGMCTKSNKLDGKITNVFYPRMKKRSKSTYKSNTITRSRYSPKANSTPIFFHTQTYMKNKLGQSCAKLRLSYQFFFICLCLVQ